MVRKRKTPERKDVRSEYALNDDHSLLFVTRRDETVCMCETLVYEKLVARHPGCKDFEGMHQSLKYLFTQYIEDAKRCLNSTRPFTG